MTSTSFKKSSSDHSEALRAAKTGGDREGTIKNILQPASGDNAIMTKRVGHAGPARTSRGKENSVHHKTGAPVVPFGGDVLLKATDLDRLIAEVYESLAGMLRMRKRKRVLVRRGTEYVLLPLADVMFFYSSSKSVFAVEKSGKKFVVDKQLSHLQAELDDHFFFRANRQYIINLTYIRSFKSYERVKLSVELTMNMPEHFITISQETASIFKKWISEA